jgi:hypothetical protein
MASSAPTNPTADQCHRGWIAAAEASEKAAKLAASRQCSSGLVLNPEVQIYPLTPSNGCGVVKG